MTDTHKDFEEYYQKEYDNFPPLNELLEGESIREFSVYEVIDAWQACQSLNDKRIQQLLAVIAKKDEILTKIRCTLYEHGVSALSQTLAKEAIAIKLEDLELKAVGRVISDRSGTATIGDEIRKLPSGTLLYTIKTKE